MKKIVALSFLVFQLLTFQSFAAEKTQLDVTDKNELDSVLSSYEKLHQSFFQYDAKSAQKIAGEMVATIAKIKNKDVVKLLEFSKKTLSEITESKSRDDNNQNLHLVSMALGHVINKYEVSGKYNVFYCPMIKKKWIQNTEKSSEVNNPYAPEMPHCGGQESHH